MTALDKAAEAIASRQLNGPTRKAVSLVKRLAALDPKDIQTGDDVAHHFWKFYRQAKAIVGEK